MSQTELKRLAVAAYPIEWLAHWQAAERKLSTWVAEAASAGAALAVFPEYAAMELASLDGAAVAADLERSVLALNERLAAIDDLHARLSREFDIVLVAGSAPVLTDSGRRPVNRARVFYPDGSRGYQDKCIMTRFERERWQVRGGQGLTVFDSPLGRFGICICYDIEFPQLARELCEAGAEFILAPSCTDTLAGYFRVRIGARARALENQCIVAMAPTVGVADWSPAVDENHGSAAIFGPPDLGFPDDGIIASGGLDEAGWVTTVVDLAALRHVRNEGQVLNWQHRREPESAGRLAGPE